MELIIKPTELCNFKCTFCSSPNLSSTRASVLDLKKIEDFLDRFPNTSNIIVNGGDPLMLSPDYYYKILDLINERKMDTILSFTTNLWDFYLHPEKWTELFNHKQVGVGTSFNYGETRRISNKRAYTEEDFWKVSDLFLEKVGYRPDFISVINTENEHSAINNVRLAKAMGVECKLNYAVGSGRQSNPYTLSKIYKIYLQIIEEDLTDWEFNTKQIINKMQGSHTICPRSRNCDEHIRCLQPDGDYYSCGAYGDDKEYGIDFNNEMNSPKVSTPLQSDYELDSMKSECLTCPMFELCNGCRKTVKDMKVNNIVEEHCKLMKTMQSKLLELA